MTSSLRLEKITEDNVEAACRLKVRPDQEEFVEPVAWSLAEAYVHPQIAWPRLIFDGEHRWDSSWASSWSVSTRTTRMTRPAPGSGG